jgi:protein involved in sex pheromone biosynthesis
MIRTILKPEKQKIFINLPIDFVGKQVEIVAFTIEEADKVKEEIDNPFTHFASEKVLAKDWLTPEEDLAWQNL